MRAEVEVECPVHNSFRVEQVRGMFDMTAVEKARCKFSVEIPGMEEDWRIGLIVGPSGSGKSSVARHVFAESFYEASEWPADKAVVDAFPADAGIRAITQTLGAVGFSSPPAWLKPYGVLSNGEKFRCDLARAMLSPSPLVVYDEFTSLVDRTVARIGSAALAKSLRAGRIGKRFVAVTCHYDIAEWLMPDWVVDMATQTLARGLLRRPEIKLEIRRVTRDAWRLFERHHYLSSELHPSSACFVGSIDGSPAAFIAVIHFPHPTASGWHEHRTVVLPDFQGIGVGNRLADFVAGMYVATGKPYRLVTSHPAFIHSRMASKDWRCTRAGRMGKVSEGNKHLKKTNSAERITMSFEYVGKSRPDEAKKFGVLK